VSSQFISARLFQIIDGPIPSSVSSKRWSLKQIGSLPYETEEKVMSTPFMNGEWITNFYNSTVRKLFEDSRKGT
jgi:hypothetical protein